MTLFIRLLDQIDKSESLKDSIDNINNNNNAATVYEVEPDEFKAIPTSPYAYWVSKNVRETYSHFEPVECESRIVRQGLATAEDFRFVRNWWEVVDNRWSPFAKGGEYSPYYSDLHLVTNWSNDGREIKAGICNRYPYLNGNANFVAKNPQHYFRPGLTWSRRTTSGLSMRVLPKGAVFADKGPALFRNDNNSNNLSIDLAVMSSAAYKYIVSLQLAAADAAARSYEVGIIQKTPLPDFSETLQKELIDLVEKAVRVKKQLDSVNETSHYFILPELLLNKFADISYTKSIEQLKSIQKRIDEICFEAYMFNSEDALLASEQEGLVYSDPELSKKEKENTKSKIYNTLSWAVGVAFGRFTSKIPSDELLKIDNEDLFEQLPLKSPAMAVSNDELNASGTLERNGKGKYSLSNSISKILCDMDFVHQVDIDKFLEKDFFSFHLKSYSKSRRSSPIYWPLETHAGSYSLWCYAHKLTNQTLLTCVNDFIDPKLNSVSFEVNELVSKSSKTRADEKEIERLSNLKVELEDFKNEIIRISKFWHPNLNDGVQITVAPLWRLFQHKAWQKKLKQTWEKLEDGDYDWAHLAYTTWPERVLKKCHADRSIAIAHGVETDLWHQVEVIKGKKKEPVWEWQPKSLSPVELNDYVREKIASDDRLALYRSNAKNSGVKS